MKQAVERKMTKSEKAKEERLKDKYDDSDMKDNMKDQYGDDWKNVYYATIRKKAMASFKNNNSMIAEDTISTVKDAINILGKLRGAGKQLERGQKEYKGNLANEYVNSVWNVYTWLENRYRDEDDEKLKEILKPVFWLRGEAKKIERNWSVDLERTDDTMSAATFGNMVVNTLYPLMQWMDMNEEKIKNPMREGEAGDHERMYKVVHVKKGMMDIKAKTSYEAAKKFAKEKGLKSTAGVDTHLYPLEEASSPWTSSGKHPEDMSREELEHEIDIFKQYKKMGMSLSPQEIMRMDSLYDYLDTVDEECRYCGGDCPNDEENACDGYLGDIDNLYGTKTDDDMPVENMHPMVAPPNKNPKFKSNMPIAQPNKNSRFKINTDFYKNMQKSFQKQGQEKPWWMREGYKVLPKVDTDKYPEIPGLEGPFQTMAGKPIYYDPKEGSYYDKDTDMYLTYAEFKALDDDYKGMNEASMPVNATPKMHKLDVREDAPISQMSRADLLDYLNMSEKDAQGISTQELMDMAQDVTMDQMEQKKTDIKIRLPGNFSKITKFKVEGKKKNKMGPQGITPGDRVEHEGDMYEVIAVDGDILTVNNLQNGNRTQFRMDDVTRLFGADAMTDQDEEDLEAMFKRLDKVGSGSLKHVATEGDGRKKGIHPKGHPMRQKQQAAIHANSVDLNAMRDALKLDERTDANTVVAEYTRACLDLSHNTWGKVCEQIDHVRSFVKEDIDIENVRIQLRKMHEREALDRNILIKENIDKLRDIVKNSQAMSIKFTDGSMKVDLTTASIFLQVFDKVKEETQAKIVDRIQTKQGFLSVLDKMYNMIG